MWVTGRPVTDFTRWGRLKRSHLLRWRGSVQTMISS